MLSHLKPICTEFTEYRRGPRLVYWLYKCWCDVRAQLHFENLAETSPDTCWFHCRWNHWYGCAEYKHELTDRCFSPICPVIILRKSTRSMERLVVWL